MKQTGKLLHKVIIFMIIFCSADTLLFGTNKDTRFILLRYLVEASIVVILLGNQIYKEKVAVGRREVIFMSMILLVLCSGIFNDDIRLGYFYIIMLLALGLLLSRSISFDEFAESFCSYIKLFSVISIAFFVLYVCCNQLVQMLPIITNTADRQSYTMIFSSMPTEFYHNEYRNSSIFREPGVFQMYLIWALMIEMFWKKKMNIVNCGIYVIALLTTFSTTAYIAAAMLLVCYFIKKGNNRDWIIKGFLVFLGGIVLIYVLEFTNLLSADGIIFGKFTQNNNPSVSARWASVVVNCIMIFQKPIWGNGLSFVDQNYSNYAMEFLEVKVADNTNMILYLMATMGILYGIIFVIGIWKICGKFVSNKLLQLGFLGIFVVLFIGENLVFSPITYILIFYGFERTIPCEVRKECKYENNVVV